MQDQLALKEKRIKELKEEVSASKQDIEYMRDSLSFLKYLFNSLRSENESFEQNLYNELSLRNELEFTIKELEMEKQKQTQEISNLQRDLLKTDETEEKVIIEILEKQKMKEEFDASLANIQNKNDTLLKEKQELKNFFEKKIENLNQDKKNLNEKLSKMSNQVTSLQNDKEKIENSLNEKIIEIKEIGIQYENQIMNIRQNFEESLENFKTNFKIQSGEIDSDHRNNQIGNFKKIRKLAIMLCKIIIHLNKLRMILWNIRMIISLMKRRALIVLMRTILVKVSMNLMMQP